MKVTKRQLRRIIKEEKAKLLSEVSDHEMYTKDDALRELGAAIDNMISWSSEVDTLMKDMGYRYGELAALGTDTRTVKQSVQKIATTYASKLDDITRFSK